MQAIELIGVPFDGYGRPGNQARAAAALRAAGLEAAFTGREVVAEPDPILPQPDPERAPGSGLINEIALLAMVDTVQQRVGAALAAGRFPLVYGADCTVLLGAIPALRDAEGEAALLFADGHEDTTPLDASPDGEAANMELGLLLGLTGWFAPARLRAQLPALRPEALALLGQRDELLRRECNVASLADRGVWFRSPEAIAADPAACGQEAVAHVQGAVRGWWLHTDLDVLAGAALAAQGLPGEEADPGGLQWSELAKLTISALESGGCRGWSITIYDPDQDPDGADAQRIVAFVSAVAASLPS